MKLITSNPKNRCRSTFRASSGTKRPGGQGFGGTGDAPAPKSAACSSLAQRECQRDNDTWNNYDNLLIRLNGKVLVAKRERSHLWRGWASTSHLLNKLHNQRQWSIRRTHGEESDVKAGVFYFERGCSMLSIFYWPDFVVMVEIWGLSFETEVV